MPRRLNEVRPRGYAPGPGSARSVVGRRPYQGHSPFVIPTLSGEA